jgi:hypothetical protein
MYRRLPYSILTQATSVARTSSVDKEEILCYNSNINRLIL